MFRTTKIKVLFFATAFFMILIIVGTSYIYTVKFHPSKESTDPHQILLRKLKMLENDVTPILKYNYEAEKFVLSSVHALKKVFPNVTIVIACDSPVFKFEEVVKLYQVKVIYVSFDLNEKYHLCLGKCWKTKFVLIMPVGVKPPSSLQLLKIIEIFRGSKTQILAIPVDEILRLQCLGLKLNLIEWTISYRLGHASSICGAVQGDHAIFMGGNTFQQLHEPFLELFPEALYIQAAANNIKTKILTSIILSRRTSNYPESSGKKIESKRAEMYRTLKIKRVIRETGIVEWYGCSRQTTRCFGDIVDNAPDYLLLGRWTPPCCLSVLRDTLRHVSSVFKQFNITFWLEGGSLLGAMRNKNVIPWDYDVDLGMYERDVTKCPWLKLLLSRGNEVNNPWKLISLLASISKLIFIDFEST